MAMEIQPVNICSSDGGLEPSSIVTIDIHPINQSINDKL